MNEHSHGFADIAERLEAGARPTYVRDWIYGGIDGAVTTFAIVAGVIGAELSVTVVLVLGLANLLADGFSMAAANYSGTRSEHEERARLIAIEKRHIATFPEGERREVREIFRRKGFQGEDLDRLVDGICSDEDLWIEVMLAEEYGQPAMLRDPLTSAGVTFAAFIAAGAVPLAPFALGLPGAGFWALGLTAGVFFAVGAAKSRWSLSHWLTSGLETLGIGLAAAGVAYGVGAMLKGLI